MARQYEFDVLFSDGRREKHAAVMSGQPTWAELRTAVLPFLPGAGELQHLAILKPGSDGREVADMFIDELGHPKTQDRNEEATRLYRAGLLKHWPAGDPEVLPFVAGIALVFEDDLGLSQ
jgi:hypothetical protein